MTPDEEFNIDYNTFRYQQMKIKGYLTCADRSQILEWVKFIKEIRDDYKRGWDDCREYYGIVKIDEKAQA